MLLDLVSVGVFLYVFLLQSRLIKFFIAGIGTDVEFRSDLAVDLNSNLFFFYNELAFIVFR